MQPKNMQPRVFRCCYCSVSFRFSSLTVHRGVTRWMARLVNNSTTVFINSKAGYAATKNVVACGNRSCTNMCEPASITGGQGVAVANPVSATTRPLSLMACDRRQTISDALQITLDALQITLDALHIRKSILGCLLRLVRASWFVLRAVRDDGTGSEVGALIGVPYRRSLHEADSLFEVGLVR